MKCSSSFLINELKFSNICHNGVLVVNCSLSTFSWWQCCSITRRSRLWNGPTTRFPGPLGRPARPQFGPRHPADDKTVPQVPNADGEGRWLHAHVLHESWLRISGLSTQNMTTICSTFTTGGFIWRSHVVVSHVKCLECVQGSQQSDVTSVKKCNI